MGQGKCQFVCDARHPISHQPSEGGIIKEWKQPFLGPVVIGNNLVMRDIMISVNEEGQSFSKSMEVLKNDAHGVSTMVGPKVLIQLPTLDESFPMSMLLKQSYLSTLLNR
jgi:hypothetical protein